MNDIVEGYLFETEGSEYDKIVREPYEYWWTHQSRFKMFPDHLIRYSALSDHYVEKRVRRALHRVEVLYERFEDVYDEEPPVDLKVAKFYLMNALQPLEEIREEVESR